MEEGENPENRRVTVTACERKNSTDCECSEITMSDDEDYTFKRVENPISVKKKSTSIQDSYFEKGLFYREPLQGTQKDYFIKWAEPENLTILIIKKPFDQEVSFAFLEILKFLRDKRIRVMVEMGVYLEYLEKDQIEKFELHPFKESKKCKVNMIVTIGGDGTVLAATKLFKTGPIPPLMSLGLGSLNYLCNFDLSTAKESLTGCLNLDNIKNEICDYQINLRSRLQCTLVPAKGETSLLKLIHTDPHKPEEKYELIKSIHALNEITIDRGCSQFITSLKCYINDNFLTHIQGDGILIASPTGSTAYNLSAGGSLVHTEVPSILFTPMCPHSLSFRPIIFPEDVQLKIKNPKGARSTAWVSIDSHTRFELKKGEALIIKTSSFPCPYLIRKIDDPLILWCNKIKETLSWNTRLGQKHFES